MRRNVFFSLLLVGLALLAAGPASASYQLFEAGQVRPIAISPDGATLVAANTPDDQLEIFTIQAGGVLSHSTAVRVGMRPVAVAFRGNDEVWVVNHLSDSVSIVDLSSSPAWVKATLLVGDEPRDIVFAGTAGRAFISTAHRGQHRTDPSLAVVPGAGDPQFTSEGIGRADVWVFDPASLGNVVGGTPVSVLTFFADTPRALATDGTTVYVAAFHSGNQTTAVPETAVPNGFANSCGGGGVGTGVPGPSDNASMVAAPETGVIVKFDGSDWLDAQGCSWNAAVQLSLPDQDVFAVNANTLAAGTVFSGVGTVLFNMLVNPVTGKLYVSNTESRNEVRFEGSGDHGTTTVQGRLSEARISVLDPTGPSVDPQHLNQHIDYSQLHTDMGANHAAIDAQIPHSLATPLQMAVSGAPNQKVYVAAFGSSKIGVFDVTALEDASFETNFDPTLASASYIPTGGGPAGLALNTAGDRLYVLTRFDNSVSVVDVSVTPGVVLQALALHDAEPASLTDGRPFLYDAAATSGNGEASCASCHIFGDLDSLGWNLGDPDLAPTSNPQQVPPGAPGSGPDFHPMKGPMTTQTLRGLSTHGGMHWRGDRTNGFFNPTPSPCVVATEGDCDEETSFNNFIVAFEGLIGHDGPISTTDMQKFTDFALQLMQPPNPVAAIDGTQTADQSAGETLYFNEPADGGVTCNACHTLDPAQGFFGSGGFQTFEGEPQLFKVAHLRNAYSKIGMFGLVGATGFLGDQVRGFGFLHDGALDTMFNFLETGPFTLTPAQSAQLEQFMLAFPSDLAPVVGQQVTLTTANEANTDPRIDLLIQRCGTAFTSLVLGGTVTECELVVKGSVGGVERGWVLESGGLFRDDLDNTITDTALRGLANSEGPLTYTAVPPGSGARAGIDRDVDALLDGVETNTGTFVSASDTGTDPANADTDGDGFDDGAEVQAGTDPTDPFSFPGVPSAPGLGPGALIVLAVLTSSSGARALRRRDRRT